MHKLFPTMTNRPDTERVVGTFAYWFLSIVLIPLFLPFLLQDFYSNMNVLVWTQILYHVLNCVAMILIHRQHLYYAVFDFRLKWKQCLGVILGCAAAILVAWYALVFSQALGNSLLMLPLVEVELMMFSWQVLEQVPLVGLLCIVLAAPIATCCMIYVVGFAPGGCSKRPWLGYLAVAVVASLPRVLNTSLAIDAATLWPLYLMQLPIHLICCWAYQKTDTVIVPMGIQAIVNLLGSLYVMFI